MTRLIAAPRGRRLFTSNRLDGRSFILAPSLDCAFALDAGATPASVDDLAEFLREFASGTTGETVRALGVSRQTLHLWRKRAGQATRPVAPSRKVSPSAVVALLIDGLAVEEVATRSRCHASTVRRIARDAGLEAPRRACYPPAEKLLELAAGKTWRELAAAIGRTANAARAYVAARPELARALRAVMARRAPERSNNAQ